MRKLSIAALMYGLPGGSRGKGGIGGWLDPEISLRNYRDVLLKDFKVDFFCHTWATPMSEKICRVYSPVRFKASIPLEKPLFDLDQFAFSDVVQFPGSKTRRISLQELWNLNYRASSRWSSTAHVVRMYKQAVEEQSFKHDWLVLLRYDLFFLSSLDLASLPLSCSVVVSNRPPNPRTGERGPTDDFFVAFRPEVIDTFTGLDKSMAQFALNPRRALEQRLSQSGLEVKERLTQKDDYFLVRDLLQSFLSTRGGLVWLISFGIRFARADFGTVGRMVYSIRQHLVAKRQLRFQLKQGASRRPRVAP